jgi:ribosomal protein S18 acetylase RimI-like enzyme
MKTRAAAARDKAVVWAPLTEADLPALSGLMTAIEHYDEPAERHTLDELQEAFNESGADPEHNAKLGRDSGGTVVAYGWVHPFDSDLDPRRVFLSGGVHPGWRRRGIGHQILDWQLKRAAAWDQETRRPEHGPLQLIISVEEKLAGRARLAKDRKFEPVRWFADMSLRFEDLAGGLPAIPVIDGIRLVPFSDRLSEAVRQAHNEAFADHWGSQPVPENRWQERLEATASRAEWSWVAVDTGTDEVAGYAMNAAYPQDWDYQGYSEGWTDRLGVRRRWRNRGIARALLIASMHSFAGAGLEGAGLGVDTDNPCGAFELYTRLGYSRGETQVMYVRTLPR